MIKLSYVMKRSDWIKLSIIIAIGAISYAYLFNEYAKMQNFYQETMNAIEKY